MKGPLFMFSMISCVLATSFLLNCCAALSGSDQIRLNTLTLKTLKTGSGEENLCLEMEFNKDPTSYLKNTVIIFKCENCVSFSKPAYQGIPFDVTSISRAQCPGCYLMICKADAVYVGTSSNARELRPRIRKNTYTILIPWEEHFGNRHYLYLWSPKIEFREKYKKGEVLQYSRQPDMGL